MQENEGEQCSLGRFLMQIFRIAVETPSVPLARDHFSRLGVVLCQVLLLIRQKSTKPSLSALPE